MKPTGRPKSVSRIEFTKLEELPNVGSAVAGDLRLLGISHPKDLIGRDRYRTYDDLCRVTGQRHDPCMLDTFIAAVRFMGGEPAKPWCAYTAERKRRLNSDDDIGVSFWPRWPTG